MHPSHGTKMAIFLPTIAAVAYAVVADQPQWHLFALGVGCIAWVVVGRRWRVLAFNVGVLSLVAFVFVTLTRPVKRWQEFSVDGGIAVVDPVLGHRPKPNLRVRARGFVDDTPTYEVTYETDAFGLRVGPEESLPAAMDCVLFFGGSFTFGEGVENDETMPYRVAVLARGRFSVRNFGFAGYGPHQMLAQIESGFVEAAARCRPRFAIYQAIPHHALRAAGKWDQDSSGPDYQLATDGTVTRIGNFGDREAAGADNAGGGESWSEIPLFRAVANMEDVMRLHAIVKRSRDLLRARYPGVQFHVLHWDIEPPPLFAEGWNDEGIVVHRLSTVLPFDDDDATAPLLIPRDGHPTPATHRKIAAYVAEVILGLDVLDAAPEPVGSRRE